MWKLVLLCALLSASLPSRSQTGADTIHYKKVYYFAGTGLAVPLGKTREVLSPKLFAGSMGVDFTLKNPKYYLYPALYTMSFNYKQQYKDPAYNKVVEDGHANIYLLSLAAGSRRQYQRLNTYAYVGPTIGLVSEPRANVFDDLVKMENAWSLSVGMKTGIGADYKFKRIFICGEMGYLFNLGRIQGRPLHAMTLLFGLKTDVTRIKDKVADILSIP